MPIDFGDFKKTEPFSRNFGLDRGSSIDYHYIRKFMEKNKDAIKGRVLEFHDDRYTQEFGGQKVTKTDIMDLQRFPRTTIVADLQKGENVPSNSFDCIICTQVLHTIYDQKRALYTLHRILRNDGTLLLAIPGITQRAVSSEHWWPDQCHWTSTYAKRILKDYFRRAEVKSWGNVFSATMLLWGLSLQELEPEMLDVEDPEYELVITAKCVK